MAPLNTQGQGLCLLLEAEASPYPTEFLRVSAYTLVWPHKRNTQGSRRPVTRNNLQPPYVLSLAKMILLHARANKKKKCQIKCKR